MNYNWASLSEAGPRATNEDAIGVWKFRGGQIIAGIADGLGGLGGGDFASQLAIEMLGEWAASDRGPRATMFDLANHIHETIRSAQSEHADRRNMATTLTAIEINGHHMSGVHCGDTRAAIARGSGIRRLTIDHSEGERFYRLGKITKEELKDYPRKNILDSALGIPSQPVINTFSFEIIAGDRVFLTTDGVHQKVLLRELHNISMRHTAPQPFVSDLAREVKARIPNDNYSIIAVFCS